MSDERNPGVEWYAAGVAILVWRDGKVLTVTNRKYGGFSLPGGGINPGELPIDAAARELKEETGTTSEKPLVPLGATLNLMRAGAPDICVTFAFIADIGTQEPSTVEEGTVPAWMVPRFVSEYCLYPDYSKWVLEQYELRAKSKGGSKLIADERERQQTEESWSAEEDDRQTGGQLGLAGASYAASACGAAALRVEKVSGGYNFVDMWPWNSKFDKRGQHSRLRQLVIGGALIAAEIDRLLRLPAPAPTKRRPANTPQPLPTDAHIYVGPMTFVPPCQACGQPARSAKHFANAKNVCDMMLGPCACGASHFEGEKRRVWPAVEHA